LLLDAAVLAIIVGMIAGGRVGRLKELDLRVPWVFVLAAAAQVGLMALGAGGVSLGVGRAPAESFFQTLKHEKVKPAEYQNSERVAGCIPAFIEQLYKRERLRAALGCLRPVEFENNPKPTGRAHLPAPP